MERNTIGGGNTATGKVALWSDLRRTTRPWAWMRLFGNPAGDHDAGVAGGRSGHQRDGEREYRSRLRDRLDSGENNAALGFNAGGALYAGYGDLYLGAEIAREHRLRLTTPTSAILTPPQSAVWALTL